MIRHALPLLLLLLTGFPDMASGPLQPMDVFELEHVSDTRVSPDGKRVVYVRNFFDVMADTRRTNLWVVELASGEHRPLTTGLANDGSPRWSPDGKRLLYTSAREGGSEMWLRWMEGGHTAKLTRLDGSPQNATWSRDGKWIAFTMYVPADPERFATMPAAPKGASWAAPPKVISRLTYRFDGQGYQDPRHRHVFVLPVDGGTPRRLTTGNFDHNGSLAWTTDGAHVLFSANRSDDWDMEPGDTDLYSVAVADGTLKRLTERHGPDNRPRVSPDGKYVAWVGYEERYQGYQVGPLQVMKLDGSGKRVLSQKLDRRIAAHEWSADGKGLFIQYNDTGNTKLALLSLSGELTEITSNVGGLSLGRPYAGGSFSVGGSDTLAFTLGASEHPAELGVVKPGGSPKRLTRVNDDLFSQRELGEVEPFWFESSHDGRRIQGWIVKPPGFDPSRRYPLILEIHGGPFAAYSDFFSMEMQLFASAGYVGLYINPRGSDSYGEAFGNLIHHAYPGHDYDDLMSGVDAVIGRGYVDPKNLFVTGGSGGGVLTAWIVGHTDRFAAAVSAKPVINWYSFVLTADIPTIYKNWFPGLPWEHTEHYMQRSPLQYVGNVTTPTMMLTGEVDYRTPMSETEQFYTALKLQGVETRMVRIQQASHGIAARPSNLIAKVVHILEWFDRHRVDGESPP